MHVDEGAKVAKQLKHSEEEDYEKQYNAKICLKEPALVLIN